jgi:hypothetical protein
MSHVYRKHYTVEQARAMLPQVRVWLTKLTDLRSDLEALDQKLSKLLGLGDDLGGEMVNRWVKTLAETKEVLEKFQEKEIQIKDLDRGLLDFPALIGGKEVFLCWEKDEDDIEFWHDLDSGYSGREKL